MSRDADDVIEQIRSKIARNRFELSQHAVDQSIIRDVRVDELREAVASGTIIEDYPEDKYGPSCLMLGFTAAVGRCTCNAAIRRALCSRSLPCTSRNPNGGCLTTVPAGDNMNATWSDERLAKQLVTYALELDGQLVLVEHVPARVNEETGERFFAPDTVERLQQIVREKRTPSRVVATPVFDFAA
jgi:hypothetical protein